MFLYAWAHAVRLCKSRITNLKHLPWRTFVRWSNSERDRKGPPSALMTGNTLKCNTSRCAASARPTIVSSSFHYTPIVVKFRHQRWRGTTGKFEVQTIKQLPLSRAICRNFLKTRNSAVVLSIPNLLHIKLHVITYNITPFRCKLTLTSRTVQRFSRANKI